MYPPIISLLPRIDIAAIFNYPLSLVHKHLTLVHSVWKI